MTAPATGAAGGAAAPPPPADLLISGARHVCTMDADGRELPGGWVAITGGVISGVGGPGTEPEARQRIDATTTSGRTSPAPSRR